MFHRLITSWAQNTSLANEAAAATQPGASEEPVQPMQDGRTHVFRSGPLGQLERLRDRLHLEDPENIRRARGMRRATKAFIQGDENAGSFALRCLECGGDPNAYSATGNSVMYEATNPNAPEGLLAELLARGGNPNLPRIKSSSRGRGDAGETPLHEAVRNANVAAVKTLMGAKSTEPMATSAAGQTALNLAQSRLRNKQTGELIPAEVLEEMVRLLRVREEVPELRGDAAAQLSELQKEALERTKKLGARLDRELAKNPEDIAEAPDGPSHLA